MLETVPNNLLTVKVELRFENNVFVPMNAFLVQIVVGDFWPILAVKMLDPITSKMKDYVVWTDVLPSVPALYNIYEKAVRYTSSSKLFITRVDDIPFFSVASSTQQPNFDPRNSMKPVETDCLINVPLSMASPISGLGLTIDQARGVFPDYFWLNPCIALYQFNGYVNMDLGAGPLDYITYERLFALELFNVVGTFTEYDNTIGGTIDADGNPIVIGDPDGDDFEEEEPNLLSKIATAIFITVPIALIVTLAYKGLKMMKQKLEQIRYDKEV